MPNFTLATCKEFPCPDIDQPLRDALSARGHMVNSAPWDGPQDAFHAADVVVIRACWDYSENAEGFGRWIDQLEQASVHVLNPPDLIRWNMDKRYLLELQAAGIPVPKTVLVDTQHKDRIAAEIETHGWEEAVAKPLIGQSGRGVIRLHRDQSDNWPVWDGAESHLILQEFCSNISNLGETIMIFFDGQFSHSVLRVIAPGEWRSNFRFGARRVRCEVSPGIIEQAAEVLSVLDEPPLYARVDGLVDGNKLTVMELELIEPDLGFAEVPSAAEEFVKRIENQIRS